MKITYNLCQDNQPVDADLNFWPPKFEARMPITQPWQSVWTWWISSPRQLTSSGPPAWQSHRELAAPCHVTVWNIKGPSAWQVLGFLQIVVDCHKRLGISWLAEHLSASHELFTMHVTVRSWKDNEVITAGIIIIIIYYYYYYYYLFHIHRSLHMI
jgi:hypothetical protein